MIKSSLGRVLLFSVATLVVTLVGFSRIALGAHYFTDVLAGMLFGSAWLTLCFVVARPLQRFNLPPVIENGLPKPEHELVPAPVSVQADAIITPSAQNSFV